MLCRDLHSMLATVAEKDPKAGRACRTSGLLPSIPFAADDFRADRCSSCYATLPYISYLASEVGRLADFCG